MKNWRINVTVAAVIEHENKFLMIEEHTRDGILINQPAGHLEANESPYEAIIRETLEETAYEFTPQYLLGTYFCQALSNKDDHHVTYLRFAFGGQLGRHYSNQALDAGIIQAFWLSLDDIYANQARLRSPLVLQCILDYQQGKRQNLDSIYCHESIWQVANVQG